MNRKYSLVVGLILGGMTASTFAMDITNGKLLSHRQWTTGNVISSSEKDVGNKPNMFIKKARDNAEAGKEWIYSFPHVDVQETAALDEEVSLSGGNQYKIANMTAAPHTYKITTKLCSMVTDSCVVSEDQVELNENGGAEASKEMFMSVKYGKDADGCTNYWDGIYMDTMIEKVNKNGSETSYITGAAEGLMVGDDSNNAPNNTPNNKPDNKPNNNTNHNKEFKIH